MVIYSKNNQNGTNVRTEPIRLVRHGEPNRTEPNSFKNLPIVNFGAVRFAAHRCDQVRQDSARSEVRSNKAIRPTDSVRIFGALHFEFF